MSTALTRSKLRKASAWSVLALVWSYGAVAWPQQHAELLYFANDRVRTVKLVERDEILEYRVEVMPERRYRETFFDSANLQFYRGGMFLRLKESFDGNVQLEFAPGRGASDRVGRGLLRAVGVPASRLPAAREGRIDASGGSLKSLQLPQGDDFKRVQLAVEYGRHSVALTRSGKPEFIVSLLTGSFEGFSGRKLRKEFWALQIETAGPATAAQLGELARIRDYLIADLKFQKQAKSLYAYGVEKVVLLRPEERRLEAVNLLGGSRGKAPDQFDEPDALAFTLDGRLIAGDTENARFKIYRFEESSQSIQIVGREGTAAGEFGHGLVFKSRGLTVYHQVQGIAVDKNGLIFVIDQGNQRIQVFTPQGEVLAKKAIPLIYCPSETPRCAGAIWRPLKGQYTSLQGLAIDQDGAVFVSDSGTSRVYRYLPSGEFDGNFRIPETDPVTQKPLLKEPESMAVYQDKLFVANEGTGDIKIFNRKSGAPVEPVSFGADVFAGDAEGIGVVGDYLFAVDVQNSRIAVFDLRAAPPKFLMGFVGDFESGDGIAIDPTGKYVAVADQGNLRIVLFSLPEIMNQLAALKPQR